MGSDEPSIGDLDRGAAGSWASRSPCLIVDLAQAQPMIGHRLGGRRAL